MWWLAAALLDSVAPVRCAGCDRVGSPLCRRCQAAVAALPHPRIPHASVAFPYGGVVRSVLHRGKFRDARSALGILADVAADRLTPPGVDAVVVPVPLSRRRQAVRGYNQAALVARVVAEHHDLAVATALLRRVRDTAPQSTLRSDQRRHNVRAAFAASEEVAGRVVWLVDDVRTTGATTDAAVVALEAAGARSVAVAVLAAVL
jgi:ComF family protein